MRLSSLHTPKASQGFKNKIINGGMQIYQRGLATLTSTSTYALDRWTARAQSGTAVSGTISRDTISGFTSGYALLISGSWTTGRAQIEHHIEGDNCAPLVNADITVSAKVRHDYGSSVNYYIAVGYANAKDSFSGGTTQIGVSAAIPVTTGTTTDISFTLNAGTNAGNGLYVEIRTDVLTVSSKNFRFGAVQLEAGAAATDFETRSVGDELALCQRYYYRAQATGNSTFGAGFSDSTTWGFATIPFPVEMRSAPTALEQSGTASHYRFRRSGSNTSLFTSVPAFQTATKISAVVTGTTAATQVAGQGILLQDDSASAYLAWSAEL